MEGQRLSRPYKTFRESSRIEIVIEKSRFIGEAFRVEEEESVRRLLNEAKQQYPDANHHCYAYCLTPERGIKRFSDDGEPGGTAGLPMFQVLEKKDLTNALLIVTRYFGGIKLGAGGLVRAYSRAAAEAADAAGVALLEPSAKVKIEMDYAMLDSFRYDIRSREIIPDEYEYGEKVSVCVLTRMTPEALDAELKNRYHTAVKTEFIGYQFHEWR